MSGKQRLGIVLMAVAAYIVNVFAIHYTYDGSWWMFKTGGFLAAILFTVVEAGIGIGVIQALLWVADGFYEDSHH